jgi:hypothetical protein
MSFTRCPQWILFLVAASQDSAVVNVKNFVTDAEDK